MTTPTVLVLGATGTVGSALVAELGVRGAAVRAMTRRPDHEIPGAETVVGDLRDPASLREALVGIDAMFLNSPSEEEAAELQMRAVEIARDAGLGRLVLLSQFAATADSPVRFLRWHAAVEAHLAQSEIAHVVLRPNLYMQSLLGFASSIAAGWFAASAGDAAVSVIDTRDIAASAAVALTGDVHGTYTLTGPRAVTHDEIAAALATAIGRSVEYRDVSPREFAAAMTDWLPPWQLEGAVEDFAHYARGEAAEVTTAVADLTTRPAGDIIDFARDHADAFRGA
ncbi:NAD(P)H-binding protein [Agrococcus sp. ARC_14]|uniref:NmrA family NAD(P)-binding protein n=1 Tax=Agrococcus sp. ARC_14 TaxID=2919927 RepID=UPI001F053AD0|nr:NAD(P)H-binding protein [Agrococcus sp. ARC_14]MCH1881616.1 NAD(P)H-binding protein [Agrococcus sp. ARC_14]